MSITSTALDPIADLWRELRAWLAEAMLDFRGPAGVARSLAREAHAAIARRLRLIESLLMKLLLIEAAKHAGAVRSSPACGGGRELPRKREEREGDVCSEARTRPSVSRCALDNSPQSGEHREHPADPDTWLVRFRPHIPRERPAHASSGTPLALRPSEHTAHAKARRLARRFEALRRVITNPRRAIAALAAKLSALGSTAYAAARRIALSVPHRCASLGEAHATAIVLAHDSCAALRRDTS